MTMPIDEREAEFAARRLLGNVSQPTLPVALEPYLEYVGAVLRPQYDLGPDEAGFSFQAKGKWFIAVNGNDSQERQRFTVCHEIAHIVLGLPSDHAAQDSWTYVKRTPNEMYCDIFASELLLPANLFKPLVDREDLGFARLDHLSRDCGASIMAVGSRAVALSAGPSAFVFAAGGVIRYCVRSATLRNLNGWIGPRKPLPSGTVSAGARAGSVNLGPEETEPDLWFDDWDHGGVVVEEAIHLAHWDQTLTLLRLVLDEEDLPQRSATKQESSGGLLEELDGVLPWPGKKHRK